MSYDNLAKVHEFFSRGHLEQEMSYKIYAVMALLPIWTNTIAINIDL